MKIILAVIIFILSVITINASATTWADTEVDDPILEGEKCQVKEVKRIEVGGELSPKLINN